MIENTPSSLDGLNDPEDDFLDREWVRGLTRPALLTFGDQTAPMFPPIITKLAETMPSAEVHKFTGAGHPIQAEKPEDFAKAINAFVRKHTK